ncbi:MAG: VOC family protein [Cyanobacteria bacterium J06554_1]
MPVPTPRIAIDVGLTVTNMERSLHFYRDLIGLTVVAEMTTTLIGKGRMLQLKHGESLLKLVELENIPPRQGSPGIGMGLGYRYITLLVSNIDKIMTKLEQETVAMVTPATQLNNGATIAMVTDPDGNIVEFVQEIS